MLCLNQRSHIVPAALDVKRPYGIASHLLFAVTVLVSVSTTSFGASAFVPPTSFLPQTAVGNNLCSSPPHLGDNSASTLTVLRSSEQQQEVETPFFDLINATLSLSKLIYPYASCRKLVRANPDEWEDSDIILSPDAIKESDIGNWINKNRDKIADSFTLKELFYISDGLKGDNELQCFDDERQDKELVYGIAINRSEKRITVVFRGSATINDWVQNLQIGKYPVFNDNSDDITDSYYDVHSGFRNYLRGRDLTRDEDDEDDPLVSKFKIITEEAMGTSYALKQQTGDDYDLFVTGHSLGGALATFYAMKVAEFPLPFFRNPVTCITFASPYVGNKSFQRAFEKLEREGRLRHIRVSNENDAVPSNPAIGNFTHVGLNLELYGNRPPRLVNAGADTERLPVAFLVVLPAALSLIVQLLSIFFGVLTIVPTIPTIPALLMTTVCALVLLEHHFLPQHLERLEPYKYELDFFTKDVDELYESRLNALM